MAKRYSAEWKANIARSRSGHPWSPVQRESILAAKQAATLKRQATKKEALRSAFSQRFSGPGNPCYGKPVPEERKRKISQGVKRAWAEDRFSKEQVSKWNLAGREAALTPAARLKKSQNKKRFYQEHPEARAKLSKAMKARWANPEIRPRLLMAATLARQIRPTGLEKRVLAVIEDAQLPYRYTGDGSVVIGFLRPDFINTDGAKKVIEVFGEAFHHPDKAWIPLKAMRLERNRRKVYGDYGFQMLVLWGEDIKKLSSHELAERIKEF